MLAFWFFLCYYMQVLRGTTKYPGVAKFGIALEWGSRGLEFESRHSDQSDIFRQKDVGFFIYGAIAFACQCFEKEKFLLIISRLH